MIKYPKDMKLITNMEEEKIVQYFAHFSPSFPSEYCIPTKLYLSKKSFIYQRENLHYYLYTVVVVMSIIRCFYLKFSNVRKI